VGKKFNSSENTQKIVHTWRWLDVKFELHNNCWLANHNWKMGKKYQWTDIRL
jgi:hypothetical protein